MRKVVHENKHTECELKDGVERLTSMVNQLTTKQVYDALEGLEEVKQIILLDDSEEENEVPTKEDLAARPERAMEHNRKLREENARLYNELSRRSRRTDEQNVEEALESQVKKVKTYEDFVKLERKNWPENLFRSTFYAQGDPLKANKDTDLTVIRRRGGRG